MLTLIMMSGLQGTGKSTIARRLAQEFKFPLFAKDHFESILYNDNLTDGTSITSYHIIMQSADFHLSSGISCILDAVFPRPGFREQVRNIAQQNNAALKILHTFCSEEALHRQRLEERESFVPWQRITWDDTLDTKSRYQTWSLEDALFLDAVNPLETNIQKALQYILDNS